MLSVLLLILHILVSELSKLSTLNSKVKVLLLMSFMLIIPVCSFKYIPSFKVMSLVLNDSLTHLL
ncbi:hypothetical protein A0H76_1399 [Hepatospora eriocheir]|uniref:Uncharacterized protein n=1 Tax=Hepatospora eriocheir TaxID=1081669 RepID=A0A1X0Q5W0_9MICR|nr:hypothetical protein A0H76_1536 [Hepatospora eriocheir]ORD93619.1 hypothetical protein A0H76_1399 [Hepatospora eriocheir]